MKFLLVSAFIAVSWSCSAQSAGTKTKTDDSNTFIYIYRGGQFAGSLLNWTIFVDEEKLCKLSNNKYIQVPVKPGKHMVTAKRSGVGVMKKETEIEIDAEAGGTYYVACNIKQSIVRTRLEMLEVTKSTATKQMEGMSMDNCETSE